MQLFIYLFFFLIFAAAGRDSPRRATNFLARARKSAKKACWRSFGTAELATRRFAALRSDNCGESGGRRRAGYGGCALTDALWLGVAASLATQLQKIHSPSASIKRPDHQGRYPPRIPGWERETLRPPRLPGRCACSVRCKKAASGCWMQTGPGRRRLGRPLWAVSMRVAGGRQVWS